MRLDLIQPHLKRLKVNKIGQHEQKALIESKNITMLRSSTEEIHVRFLPASADKVVLWQAR